MMIQFSGRSNKTHRIKNKPIGEGYKFFALSTSQVFLINFTPDGRSAAKSYRQEYATNKYKGKIESMIEFIMNVINKFRKTQAS
eukprot:10809171-Ditylum_brightwellii.AAC.1